MDVTPIGKQSTIISSAQSGTSAASNEDMAKQGANTASASTSLNSSLTDPVKRAEEAIGSFFTDSRFPTGRFSIDHDKDSGRYVYRLIDRETDEVLKQFPGDYVLRRVAYYRELQGLSVNSEV